MRASQAKVRLQKQSASEYPPALAAFYGLGTYPYDLYGCVGFDRLHVLDLGLVRLVLDMAFTIFKRKDYNRAKMTKSALVRIANQRINDFLRRAPVSRKHSFRMESAELQEGMSGKVRRDQAALLWFALTGLQPEISPDEDGLLEAAFFVDYLERERHGVNYAEGMSMRDSEDVECSKDWFFRAGLTVARGLDVGVNTKLHGVKHHMGEYLFDFGCIRRGETDANETQHLEIKQSYLATNHEILTSNRQLIKIRTLAEATSHPNLAEKTPDAPHLRAKSLEGFC